MRIHATINGRLLRRAFRERKIGRSSLTVFDRDRAALASGSRRTDSGPLLSELSAGTADALTAGEAREKAAAAIAAAKSGHDTGPLFTDYVHEFLSRQARRWKPSSLNTYDVYLHTRLTPAFGQLPPDAITHAHISAWFDAASAERHRESPSGRSRRSACTP